MQSDLQPLERAAYITKFFDILERESNGHIFAAFDIFHKTFAVTIHGHEYFWTLDETQTFVIGWNASKTYHNKN